MTLRAEDRITIPATACSSARRLVHVRGQDNAAVRSVKIERTVDGMSVVGSGIEEGEVVVTDGQFCCRAGPR
jgi:hypothetical protein